VNIPKEVATHEAGHLVVGLLIGIQEQGILFAAVEPDEAAQAWFSDIDSAKSLRRSFGGLLAQLIVLPGSLEPHLRAAYEHSIIFTPEHPHYSRVTADERDFLSGARTDMICARGHAASLHPDSPAAGLACLREAEAETRTLLTRHSDDVSCVVADILVWATEPERKDEFMPLYPPQRANKLIRKA
jgi:hypothetical protein